MSFLGRDFNLGVTDNLTPRITDKCIVGDQDIANPRPPVVDSVSDKVSWNETNSNDKEDTDEETESDLDTDEETTSSDSDAEDDLGNQLAVTDLRVYYRSLSPAQIQEDVNLMKVATLRELYELIATNCQHYISIIEGYKEENLQTMFNLIIRRVEGHLIIKYKLDLNERWVEVGFFDNDNTDHETMLELARSLDYYLKHYDKNALERRKHIAGQLENDNPSSQTNRIEKPTKAIPDDHFNPKNNPELAISAQQLQSAGYQKVPESLKEMERSMKQTGATFDLSKFQGSETRGSVSETTNKLSEHTTSSNLNQNNQLHEVPNYNETLENFKKQVRERLHQPQIDEPIKYNSVSIPSSKAIQLADQLVPSYAKDDFTQLLHNLSSPHRNTIQLIEVLYQQLEIQPRDNHPYIYEFLRKLTAGQSPESVLACYLHLINLKSSTAPNQQTLLNRLSESQKKVVNACQLDLTKLV